jgi:hypothetical protein
LTHSTKIAQDAPSRRSVSACRFFDGHRHPHEFIEFLETLKKI